MPNKLLMIPHHDTILSIPIHNVIRSVPSHALDQVRVFLLEEFAHLSVATDSAVKMIGDGIRMEGGNHLVVVVFFKEIVDAINEVDCAGAFRGCNIVGGCGGDWRESVVA